MEINKEHSHENKQKIVIQSLQQKGSQHHLQMAETQKQAGKCKSLMVEKGKSSDIAYLQIAGTAKLEVDQLEVGHPMLLVKGAHFAFSY